MTGEANGVPAVVRAAVEGRTSTADRPRRKSPWWSTRVLPGDLRIVRPLAHLPGDSRLGLVLSVDPDREMAEVQLVHTAPELATGTDAVVGPGLSSTPYDVVVQIDVRGWVWTLQLDHAVGRLRDDVFEALNRAAPTEHPGLATGLALGSTDDPRQSFKEAERAALNVLARDCIAARREEHEERVVWSLDPRLLRPELLAGGDDAGLLLYELLHWVRTRELVLDEAALPGLDEAGALDLDRWRSLGDLGLDIWTSLHDLVVDAATGSAVREPSAQVTTAGLHAQAGPGAHDEDVHLIGRKDPATA